MPKVKVTRDMPGAVYGIFNVKAGDVIELLAHQAEDVIAQGWAEPATSRRKPLRRGGSKAEAAVVETPEQR